MDARSLVRDLSTVVAALFIATSSVRSESTSEHLGCAQTLALAVDRQAPAVTNASAALDRRASPFVLAVADDLTVQNVELRVKIKLGSQIDEQGGGLVWRYQDDDNYYVVCLDGERRVIPYKVEQGRWTRLTPRRGGTHRNSGA